MPSQLLSVASFGLRTMKQKEVPFLFLERKTLFRKKRNLMKKNWIKILSFFVQNYFVSTENTLWFVLVNSSSFGSDVHLESDHIIIIIITIWLLCDLNITILAWFKLKMISRKQFYLRKSKSLAKWIHLAFFKESLLKHRAEIVCMLRSVKNEKNQKL